MNKDPQKKFERINRWKFGQNFLVDDQVIQQIADDVPANLKDWIIEIGPGQGAITKRLAKKSRQVTALEIDLKWVEKLRAKQDWGTLDIIHTDAIKVDIDALLKNNPLPNKNKPFVVGNLPYNRAAPILFHFIPYIRQFQSISVMVQYEVAKRICAKPHSRDFGFLTVFVQNYASARLMQKISPEAFRPKPKVMSATVELLPLDKPFIQDPGFLPFVEKAFSQKRKMLINSLKPFYAKELTEAALEKLKIPETSRAEDLSVEQFAILFGILGKEQAPEK